MAEDIKVAHLCFGFGMLTETFVYEFVTKTPNTIPLVVAYQRHNSEQFPFEPVFSRDDTGIKGTYYRVIEKLYRRCMPRFSLPVSFFFNTIIAKEKPALLHAHFGSMALYGICLKKKFNIPLVTSFYGQDISELPKRTYFQKMYQTLFTSGDAFLVEGSFMKKCLAELGCPLKKIYIRHIGVDLNKFNYQERKLKEDEKVKILMCCRFKEKKGVIEAVEALVIASKKYPDMELKIIGDASPGDIQIKDKILELIKTNNLEDNVILLGYVDHARYRKEASQAHIFLQPSKTAKSGETEGGAPTVISEMQAAGLPIIATYHADIPEVVRDKESAYLSPEGDVPALAENILRMVENHKQWPEMGRIGRQHIEQNYNLIKETEKLYKIYAQVL